MKSIDLQSIRFSRGSFELGPVDLRLEAGSRTALIGPSGCGKTTLLRVLAGLESPDSGIVRLGDEIVNDQARVVVPASRRKIGFVFQDAALWPHMSAEKHIRFVAPTMAKEDARALLSRVGLEGKERRKPAQLSGGEAQRLGLARALAGNPDILLLDEPLGSVDVHLRDELAALVRSIAEERQVTLLVVTHDRDEAFAMADDLVVLHDGKVVETGATLDMLANPSTAFSAKFLAGALCLDIHDNQTALGPVSQPVAGNQVLAILPGDVRLETAAAEHEVRQVRVDSVGRRSAVLEIEGQVLVVPCDEAIQGGDRVGLVLDSPRVLPRGAAE